MKRDSGKQRIVGRVVFRGTFTPGGPQVIPVLSDRERFDFRAWLFSEEAVARRPKDRKLAKRTGLIGTHVSRQHCSYLHGSDLTERIYVAVMELERRGFSRLAACAIVAKLPYPALQSRLGKSRRGRPSPKPKGTEFERKTGTVRSIVNRYLKIQHPWKPLLPEKDVIVDRYVGEFLWLREAGIIVGSKYVPDSAARLMEDWEKRVAALVHSGQAQA